MDLVEAGNVDSKRPYLGNGQTVLMRTPTQVEFVECWSETLMRNGTPPAVVDDPLFRKVLVITSRMGQGYYFTSSTYIHQENYSGDRQEAG